MADVFELPPAAKYIYGPGERVIHIARTLIAGCQTECGITMRAGWTWTTGPSPLPGRIICKECRTLIESLPALRERLSL